MSPKTGRYLAGAALLTSSANCREEYHVQPQNFLVGCRRQPRRPGLSFAQPASQKVALYANVGADPTHYDVDVAGAELIKRETVTLPAAVQYAWPHASRRYLYVATSSSAPGYGTAGTDHHVTAFASIRRVALSHRTVHRYGCRRGPSTQAPTFHQRISWLRSTIRVRCGYTVSTRTSRRAKR